MYTVVQQLFDALGGTFRRSTRRRSAPTEHEIPRMDNNLDEKLVIVSAEGPENVRPRQYGALYSPDVAMGEKPNTVSYKLGKRKKIIERKRRACDYALMFALMGIVIMIIENELTAENIYSKTSGYSLVLKSLTTASTILLLMFITAYHFLGIQLFMVDNGLDDWRIALTADRLIKFTVELVVCFIHPVPGSLYFKWTTVHADGKTVTVTDVPVDVLLSIPMFLRLYLIPRVMLLHSKLFTDASSRSIGALNRINLNAKFVLKTLMTLCPGKVLLAFTASVWIISSWILRQCERYHSENGKILEAEMHHNYLNSLWLIAITFLTIGYGDILPNTYCGRTVCVIVGIMGVGTSSLVVAVIARKLELSRSEKRVHNFLQETKLTKRLKHAAANVLRETWVIHKLRRLTNKQDSAKIRLHQQKFIIAICDFRKIKREQRRLTDNAVTVTDMAKQTSSIYDTISNFGTWQNSVESRLTNIELLLQNQIKMLPNVVAQAVQAQQRALNRSYDFSSAKQSILDEEELVSELPTSSPVSKSDILRRQGAMTFWSMSDNEEMPKTS